MWPVGSPNGAGPVVVEDETHVQKTKVVVLYFGMQSCVREGEP